MRTTSLVALAALAPTFALGAQPPFQGAAARPFGVELPPGPAARAWAGVGADTKAAHLEAADVPPPPSAAAWRSERPWLDWAAWVRAESGAESPDPRTRARLALFAWQERRSDDAWDHLAACTAGPEWMAAALPLLLPGVPAELLASGAGALGRPLPEGVVLTPALPPSDRPASEIALGTGRVEKRSMQIDGLLVGASTISMNVTLDYDGVQVELAHRSGPRTRLAVVLPEPADFEVRVEYVDWNRQETSRAPLAVELAPGAEPVVLFGRFAPRKIEWPTNLPAALPLQIAQDGIRLELARGDPEEARLRGFASGLAALLGCKTSVRALDPTSPPEPWPGLSLQLFANPGRERKIAGLVSLAEQFALSARR